MSRNFMQLLQDKWNEDKFVCVGLDSAIAKIPKSVYAGKGDVNAQVAFNRAIVDATKDIACAYKPNLAFYPTDVGKQALWATIAHIMRVAPDVPVILDAKQGDIGNTNDGYIVDDFEYYGADAVTVHNYMGMEAMKPYLNRADKGVIVLCRTSNEGAGELQDVPCTALRHIPTGELFSTLAEAQREGREDGAFDQVTMPFYAFVAARVQQKWNYNGNCAVVVGATNPKELVSIRRLVGDITTLLPGIGAQGGDLEAAVAAGRNSHAQGMIINNSRSIIFASDNEDFAEAARAKALEMHEAIQAARAA